MRNHARGLGLGSGLGGSGSGLGLGLGLLLCDATALIGLFCALADAVFMWRLFDTQDGAGKDASQLSTPQLKARLLKTQLRKCQSSSPKSPKGERCISLACWVQNV